MSAETIGSAADPGREPAARGIRTVGLPFYKKYGLMHRGR